MAVDTRNKLFSLLRLHKPYIVNLPDPIASFDQGDLQHFLNGYSGILWSQQALAIGLVKISMSIKKPSIAMEVIKPSIAMEVIKPSITMELDECQ